MAHIHGIRNAKSKQTIPKQTKNSCASREAALKYLGFRSTPTKKKKRNEKEIACERANKCINIM